MASNTITLVKVKNLTKETVKVTFDGQLYEIPPHAEAEVQKGVARLLLQYKTPPIKVLKERTIPFTQDVRTPVLKVVSTKDYKAIIDSYPVELKANVPAELPRDVANILARTNPNTIKIVGSAPDKDLTFKVEKPKEPEEQPEELGLDELFAKSRRMGAKDSLKEEFAMFAEIALDAKMTLEKFQKLFKEFKKKLKETEG